MSIFDEAFVAVLVSASIFALADLRNLAYDNVLSEEDAKEILELPITRRRMKELEQKHRRHVEKFKTRDFTSNTDRHINRFSLPDSTDVHYIGDDHARQECVHYIGRSLERGAIVLAFRGTASSNDLRQDFKLMVAKVPNPIWGEEGQPDKVGIHRGFRTFVCYGRKDKESEEMEPSVHKGVSKLEVILRQLRAMKSEYPNDWIYITGHSLGGALALITALAVCADPSLASIPSDAPPGYVPVTCYAVGNPKPGDGDFCNAMEHLERTKKLRCCVIHNTWDIIPMLSTNLSGSHSGFWHPGWRVLVYKDRCEIGRSRAKKALLQEEAANPQCSCPCCRCCCCRRQDSQAMWSGIPAGLKINKATNNSTKERISKHNHRVYLQRLAEQESYLRKIELDDLYCEHMWDETSQETIGRQS
mmetsp:Transcript_31126/g.75222  ORF Transcript_31126/g.75222 Transcript_31126/m.75222 type:complete len:417 (-) Transcript_31126:511-1761(-)